MKKLIKSVDKINASTFGNVRGYTFTVNEVFELLQVIAKKMKCDTSMQCMPDGSVEFVFGDEAYCFSRNNML